MTKTRKPDDSPPKDPAVIEDDPLAELISALVDIAVDREWERLHRRGEVK